MANASMNTVRQQSPADIVHVQPATITSATATTFAVSGSLVIDGASAGVAVVFGYDQLTVGQELLIVNTSTNYSAEVTLPSGVTWDGTNDKATFGTGGDALLVRAIASNRFFVIANIGSVSFS